MIEYCHIQKLIEYVLHLEKTGLNGETEQGTSLQFLIMTLTANVPCQK